ncbi:MAG: glycosyltransferase family 2 protein [Flavobacteriaceae bacterium]|nr:glycosyltransferase family 2 protein [Flavobacteriaceae bacterium]
MRLGFNPNKDRPLTVTSYTHQVVIPVYIPNQEDYFKDSFQILKYCLESLFKTCHAQTFFTVVNNGSCAEVKADLDNLLAQNKIQEVLHTHNIGKLNAILKGVVGHSFPLVTIADADVLFLSHWQRAAYNIFETFPKAGVVCPTPSSRSLRTFTANIYWDLFFSKKLKFSKVKNPDALKAFAHSVGDENFYNEAQLQTYFTISDKMVEAVIGAGHFAATYRREVFQSLDKLQSSYALGGDSESQLLDIPVVKCGYWRLSTADNFAFHMGNIKEAWMEKEMRKLEPSTISDTPILFPYSSQSIFRYWIVNKLFAKLILKKNIFKHFLIWKGLDKAHKESYLK